ncbi:hypothetical protein [Nannocystis punicea]|uniref:WD40-like Beta Propeller Repeat n=1 Tax=Nannocystis punicea TaxID=2995304 RepID=A0ABY7HDF6_9BACT|nr:hypothetical protein [Nannocystis poenicansa]WAS97302.1 hypothetical protein O0S08_14235 [Nannocystis poenicansa]
MTPYHWLPTFDALVLRKDGATGGLSASAKSDGTPTITLAITPATGRPRKKAYPTIDKALGAALADGFVATVAASGALLLLTEVGASMGSQFVVDESHHCAWLGDWGQLRRVDLRDGQVTSFALGDYPAVRSLVGDGLGGVLALVDEDLAPPTEGFRAPAPELLRFAVLHCDGERIQRRHLVETARDEPAPLCLNLSRADDGSLLLPHHGGFALVDPAGAVVRTWTVGNTKYWGPRAALSPNGRKIAYTAGTGRLALVDLERGDEVVLDVEMDDAMDLAAYDDGVVDVSTGTPDWDLQRFDRSGRIAHAGHRAASYAVSPDRRWVYSCDGLWKATNLVTGERRDGQIIGAARGPKLAVTADYLYIRTSRGVFQRYARAAEVAG